jgi:hypothetical protein
LVLRERVDAQTDCHVAWQAAWRGRNRAQDRLQVRTQHPWDPSAAKAAAHVAVLWRLEAGLAEQGHLDATFDVGYNGRELHWQRKCRRREEYD